MLKYILTLLPMLMQLLVASGMYKQRRHVKYFAFWAYLWFECVRLTLLSFLRRLPGVEGAYSATYWTSQFVSTIVILFVMREVFVKLLADYTVLTRFRRHGYEICLALACLATILTSTQIQGRAFVERNIIQIQQTVSSMAVIMLVFVAAASLALGIRWRSELCGIAAGLGLQGVIDALVFTGILRRGGYTASTIGWIETGAYNFSFIIFALYFLVPQEETPTPPVRKEMAEWLQSMSETVPK